MNVLLRNLALLLCVWLMMAGVCLGKQVYLQDGGIIECQSFWQRGDKVLVKVNRDIVAEFDRSEIDLQRTTHDPANKTMRAKRVKSANVVKPAPVATPAVAVTPQPVPPPALASVPVPAAKETVQPGPSPATPSDPASPPDKAEMERKAREAATMMVEAVQKNDPELMKKALEAQRNAMPPQQAAQAKSLVITYLILILVVSLLLIVSMWVVFEKAGEAGWKSLIPIYNAYVLMVISGKPGWWFLLLLVPIVGVIILLLAMLSLAERFGRGAVFGIGLFFLPMIFFPLLAFGGSNQPEFA